MGYGWGSDPNPNPNPNHNPNPNPNPDQVDARPDCEALVQGHPFFDGLPPWDKIHEHPPPFVPQLRSVDDTKYFEVERFSR